MLSYFCLFLCHFSINDFGGQIRMNIAGLVTLFICDVVYRPTTKHDYSLCSSTDCSVAKFASCATRSDHGRNAVATCHR